VNVPGFTTIKGFLAQAKLDGRSANVAGPFGRFGGVSFPHTGERDRLRGQADDMLSISPDSFVLVYSEDGFVVVPAISVSGPASRQPVYAKAVDTFFGEFLMCFVGDSGLSAHDDATLDKLRERTRARKAIFFEAMSPFAKK